METPPTCGTCGGKAFTNGDLCTNCYGCGVFPITGHAARTMKMIADVMDKCNDVLNKCNDIFEKLNE